MYAARLANDCALMRRTYGLQRVSSARCAVSHHEDAVSCVPLQLAVRSCAPLCDLTVHCVPLQLAVRLATRHSVSLRIFLACYTIMQLAARPCSFLCALTTRGESSRPAVRPLGSP